jgi:putative transposase
VTELRHELKRPVGFILEAIAANPSLPQISRSTYYYWLNHQDPDELKHADLMKKIREIFEKNRKRYGYRRIVLQLRRDGFHVNHKTVKRLMKKMNLYGITPRAKYKSYKGDFNGTVPNHLLHKEADEANHRATYIRDFNAKTSNRIWTTDVSEFHIPAGKLYLSPILDVYDHTIVSYNISSRPDFKQTADMLDQAFTANPNLTGLIFHSDQGWQYQMAQYHAILKEHGIEQSMSRKGNCLDNCVMENFFGKMKNEMFYGHEYEFEGLDALQEAMEE